MANLREQSLWEEGIYQIETSDPVMGGENGVSNRPLRQLANRTQWLKTESARLDRLIGTNLSTVNQGLAGKADKTTQITAGAGLTGGGTLGGSIQIQMGTPGKLNGSTTNWAGSNTHTHEIDKASRTVAGVVKLINDLTTGGAADALSAEQGKVLAGLIAAQGSNAVTLNGEQEVTGLKTFGWITKFKTSSGGRDYLAAVGVTSGHTFLQNTTAGANLAIRNNGDAVFMPNGNTFYKLYHEGNKPAFADLQATPNSFAGYGITGTQTLSGSLVLSGSLYQTLALESSNGTHRVLFETQGASAYFVWRTKGAGTGGNILQLPVDRSGTLATFGTTLAHYGITDAASKAELAAELAKLVNSAPGALDTLKELAAAMGNDPNFAATIARQMGEKATKAELGGKADKATSLAGYGITDAATKAQLDALITGTVAQQGWIKYANGLIEQWGWSDGENITFPIPFPTECFVVSHSKTGTGRDTRVEGVSRTGFSSRSTGGTGRTYYIAKGR